MFIFDSHFNLILYESSSTGAGLTKSIVKITVFFQRAENVLKTVFLPMKKILKLKAQGADVL
ncbi:MAG: hypothetical protein CVV39_02970 [Planctomycetes bacterium HGW-Planctomycetes-1]|nr:MAG: hypothetical protein CVV39_02970 [Planctomycetes bacterium HGW-Planctomycetes-1]